MDTLDNTVDIEKFVEQSISQRKDWSISEDTKKEVKEKLMRKHDAMFRWTYLQWEKIKMAETDKGVKQLLDKLPGNLREVYVEIYSQKEPDSFELVVLQRVVRWVMCAPHMLHSTVLLPAICAESQWKDEIDNIINNSDLSETQLESICQHLITRDPYRREWKFPHASVAEYFEERNDPWIRNAPAEVMTFLICRLTKICSDWQLPELNGYRTSEHFWYGREDYTDFSDVRHEFQRYGLTHWYLYSRDISVDNPQAMNMVQALKRFVGEAGPGGPSSQEYQVYCGSIVPYIPRRWGYQSQNRAAEAKPTQDSMFGIVAFGLNRVLTGWWDKDLDKSKVNDGGLDLLAIAAKFGNKDLCNSLLSQGFDINRAVDQTCQSALGAAFWHNEIEFTRFLLQNGADPNRVMDDSSLLCLAARGGVELVRVLLDHGANPNLSCHHRCQCEYPLSAAARFGNLDTVEALVRKEADINPVSLTDICGSPLASAVCAQAFPVVRLLLKYGADVNASLKSGKWGSVLAVAILESRKLNMVKFLIEEAGADPGILTTSPPPDPEGLRKDMYQRGTRHPIMAIAAYLVGEGHVKAHVLKDIGLPEEYIPPDDFRGDYYGWVVLRRTMVRRGILK
ncbi:hypothetical protein ACHAPJ_010793 [Fusarium lateritium]